MRRLKQPAHGPRPYGDHPEIGNYSGKRSPGLAVSCGEWKARQIGNLTPLRRSAEGGQRAQALSEVGRAPREASRVQALRPNLLSLGGAIGPVVANDDGGVLGRPKAREYPGFAPPGSQVTDAIAQ